MASLGRYEILQEIGRGGEGIVFLAVDPSIDRKVAIKTLPIAEDPTGALRAKLRQEAKSTARLSHPNIVTVYEFAEQDQLAYIVMEYVPGKSLAAAFEAGESFDYPTVCKLLMQAAEALDHAHAEGVVHRDIKPENLMLHSRGGMKIADFGIAKVLDDVGGAKTKTGVVRGTPYYLSPEQIDLKGVSGKSDQFALGVVAYQWLTGHRPFEGESWTELLTKILTKDPPPVSAYKDSLGERVTIALLKALAKDPANRYASCCEFIAELSYALGLSTGETRPQVSTMTLQLQTPTPSGSVHSPRVEAGPAPVSTTLPLPAPVSKSRWAMIGVGVSGVIALAAVLLTRQPAAAPSGTEVATQPKAVETPAVTKTPEKQGVPASETKAPPQKPAEPARKQQEKKKPEPVAAKAVEVAKQQPQTPPQQTTQVDPAPPPESPPPSPVPAPKPAGKYFGPPEGRFSWSGSLSAGATLTITGSSASAGGVQGRGLPPSLDVSVTVDPPAVQVLSQPSGQNGYRLTLKNTGTGDVPAITIRWRERKS